MSRTTFAGVYTITNLTTGQRYIGASENIIERWKAHLAALKNGKHGCVTMQASWDKHGGQTFAFTVAALIENWDKRIEHERMLIKATNPRKLFNIQGVDYASGVTLEDMVIYCICDDYVYYEEDCPNCKRTFSEIVRKNPAYRVLSRRSK